MKLWKKILIAVVALIVLVLLGGFLVPREFDVERSIVIDSSTEQIFDPVNTLKRWPEWTTWNPTNYPNLKYSYDGPESGVGAKSSWTDPEAGNGRMEITSADASTGIEYTLDFEGFDTSYGRIRFDDAGDGSVKVSMGMSGTMGNDPISRYFGLLMDDMMGSDFEQCLTGLKTLVESAPAVESVDPPVENAPDDGDVPENDGTSEDNETSTEN